MAKKKRNRPTIAITISREMLSDVDKVVELLVRTGEKMNRSMFIENCIGAVLNELVEKLNNQKGENC